MPIAFQTILLACSCACSFLSRLRYFVPLLLFTVIASRIVILERPPVATLAESSLFVAFLVSLFAIRKEPALLALSALLNVCCLIFSSSLTFQEINEALRSPFWLTIHVLTVVSSYAFLLAASAVAHRQLTLNKYSSLATRLMEIGTGLLVIGTLLGGLWAEASWGRFWGWDPKEAWAFTTAATYLSIIHLHRKGLLKPPLLALLTVAAALVVSFTWIGLNLISTNSLHTYGFVSASKWPYALFLLIEGAFIGWASRKCFTKNPKLEI